MTDQDVALRLNPEERLMLMGLIINRQLELAGPVFRGISTESVQAELVTFDKILRRLRSLAAQEEMNVQ